MPHALRRSCLTAFCTAFLGSALALPAAAANEYEEQIKDLLVQVAEHWLEEGFEPSHEPILGSLNTRGRHSTTVTLEAGQTYVMVAVCDQDCSDLDLQLYDAADELIDEDMEEDDFPIVSAEIYRSGEFQVETEMYVCDEEPCYFGVGIFSKATEPPREEAAQTAL